MAKWAIHVVIMLLIYPDIRLEDEQNELTLVPLDVANIPPHNSVLINELKLSDFKQVLQRNQIASELSGGVLLCANGTCAIRRVSSIIIS